jgi:TctA family transporter
MIPLLSLGVPGDAVIAVPLGAFMMLALMSGPMAESNLRCALVISGGDAAGCARSPLSADAHPGVHVLGALRRSWGRRKHGHFLYFCHKSPISLFRLARSMPY